jgi:hypothetical protein
MKLTFALTSLALVIMVIEPAAAVCCRSCKRGVHGVIQERTFARDVYVPSTLEERDVVVEREADIHDRACCCSAPRANQCANYWYVIKKKSYD